MKEYLRINTFRTKSSEFYHVKNNKKKVSMNKAYILHSRFGLNIKEYKSGKLVKSHSGKYKKRSKSRRTKFGLTQVQAAQEIKKLVVSDSARHDFKDEFPALCIRAWTNVIPGLGQDFKNENQINSAIWNERIEEGSKQKQITFYEPRDTPNPQFWETPKYLLADASPWAMPVCRTQAYDKEHVDLAQSSFSPLHKSPHIDMAISMFTLTDPASTRKELSDAFVHKIEKWSALPMLNLNKQITSWDSSSRPLDTYSFTGHVNYKININPFGVTMTFRANVTQPDKFTPAFSVIVINATKRPKPRKSDQMLKNLSAVAVDGFHNYDFIYEPNESLLPTQLVCWGLAPGKTDLADMIRVLYPNYVNNDDTGDVTRENRHDLLVIARLLEIKRLGDWGQVIHTTIVTTTGNNVKHALVTGDRPCYYYAKLLADLNMNPHVLTIKGRSANTGQYDSRAVGLKISGSSTCKPYPTYVAGNTGRTSKSKTAETDDDLYYYLRADTINNNSESKLLIDFWYRMDGWYTLFTECKATNKLVNNGGKGLTMYKYISLDPENGNIYEDNGNFVHPVVSGWIENEATRKLREVALDLSGSDVGVVSSWTVNKTSHSYIFIEHLKRQLKRFNGRTIRTPNVIAFPNTPNASPRSGWKAHLDTLKELDVEVEEDVVMKEGGRITKFGDDDFDTNSYVIQFEISNLIVIPEKIEQSSQTPPKFEYYKTLSMKLLQNLSTIESDDQKWVNSKYSLNSIYRIFKGIQKPGLIEYVEQNESSVQEVFSILWEFIIHNGLINIKLVDGNEMTAVKFKQTESVANPRNKQRTAVKQNTNTIRDLLDKDTAKQRQRVEAKRRGFRNLRRNLISTRFGQTREKKKALTKLSRFGVTFRNGKFKQKSKTISCEKAWALYNKK